MDYTALKPAAVLKELSDEQLRRFWDAGRVGKIAAGDPVIREGEVEATMYILLDGVVEVSQTLLMKLGKDIGQKEKTLIRLEAHLGPCFGEMSLLEDAERSATVTTLTDATVFVMERESFDRLIDKYPEIGCRVLRRVAITVSGRLRKANSDVLKLTTALSVALAG